MATILIELQVFSELRERIPGGNKTEPMAIESGTSVRDLLESKGIEAIGDYMFVLNGRGIDADTVLLDGDRIAVFPAMGSG